VLAHAARIRDLVVTLDLDKVCVIGHSFGGGVAMSFAYQFPERTSMLGLICSGGLGPDVACAIRLATVPAATLLAHTVHILTPGWLKSLIRHALAECGVTSRAEIDAVLRALDALHDPAARDAYLRTLRGVVHWSGQRITATDRLHLLATLPVLLVAGRRDQCIPHAHAIQAHRNLPGSELAVLDTGHFPHHERPDEVAHLIATFLQSLEAAIPAANLA
jgi:pimeloyl-ACP methyl ester carboxylesterase